jgi:hypothetical protein
MQSLFPPSCVFALDTVPQLEAIEVCVRSVFVHEAAPSFAIARTKVDPFSLHVQRKLRFDRALPLPTSILARPDPGGRRGHCQSQRRRRARSCRCEPKACRGCCRRVRCPLHSRARTALCLERMSELKIPHVQSRANPAACNFIYLPDRALVTKISEDSSSPVKGHIDESATSRTPA